jgi:hypothetical protein
LAAAQAFGLPLLQPYLSRGQDVRQGVNFAVGGATAMDPSFFEGIGASDKLWTNLSLSVQLDWFEKLKPSLCDSPKSPWPILYYYYLCHTDLGSISETLSHGKILPNVLFKNRTIRLQGVFQQVPVLGGGDWGKRLQLRLLQGQDLGRRQILRPHGRLRGYRRHRGEHTCNVFSLYQELSTAHSEMEQYSVSMSIL